jgi:exodeoxyribonuclease V alpha subunit
MVYAARLYGPALRAAVAADAASGIPLLGTHDRWSMVHELSGTDDPAFPENLVVAGEGEPLAQQTVMLRRSRRFGGPIGQLAAAVNSGDGVATLSILNEGHANEDADIALHEDGSVQRCAALALRGRGKHGGYASFGQALEQWTSVSSAGSATAHSAWVTEVLRTFDQFRFLCAVREGDWGVAGVNRAVEVALERSGSIRRTGEWYAGRPVMVTRNDPSNGVFNGDVGVALPSVQGNGLRVYFLQGDQLHSVSVSRLPNVETAFAMTVHKSQGSEFAHTAVVLASSGEAALSRELVYTGITRARTALTLVSERAGLLLDAISRPTLRSSGLSRLLTTGNMN